MGSPKALMRVGDEPWWKIQRRRLDAVEARQMWVTTADVREAMRGGGWQDEPGAGVVVVEPGKPMFHSVVKGVEAAVGGGWVTAATSGSESSGVFVLPVDVPVAGWSVWRRLREDCLGRPAVPVVRGPDGAATRGHPIWLPAAWLAGTFRRVVKEAAAAPEVESLRLDHLIEADRIEVPVSDRAVAMNINTPDDLAAWQRDSSQG